MAVEACFICETDPAVRRELDPRDRCDRCRGKYTTAEVAALLGMYRRLQDHGITSEYQAKLYAETQIVAETLRDLGRAERFYHNELNTLVHHLMLHQTQDDVAAEIGVAVLTVKRSKRRGLEKLTDALNGYSGLTGDT